MQAVIIGNTVIEGNKKMLPIPQVGKTYKFYDSGKVKESRQYDATVLRVITKEESKKVMFPLYYDDYDGKPHTYGMGRNSGREISLHDIWKDTIGNDDWLYAADTDYLIECDIPVYDDNHIWFVRERRGGWYSIDIQSDWQSGELDVTNKLTEELNKF